MNHITPNQKPFVKNAADEEQVKDADQKFKSLRDRELNDLRLVLSTTQGRRFVWRLLGHCSVFKSIWEPSAKIHYNAGVQDVGHFVQAEVVQADQKAYLAMMNENSKGETNV